MKPDVYKIQRVHKFSVQCVPVGKTSEAWKKVVGAEMRLKTGYSDLNLEITQEEREGEDTYFFYNSGTRN
jgi:hypothetical protein